MKFEDLEVEARRVGPDDRLIVHIKNTVDQATAHDLAVELDRIGLGGRAVILTAPWALAAAAPADLLELDGKTPQRLRVVDLTPEGHATRLFGVVADYGWAERILFSDAYETDARQIASVLAAALGGVPVDAPGDLPEGHRILAEGAAAVQEPKRWWSDLSEEDLRAELADLTKHMDGFEIVRAWTDEPHGAAFADLEDGRRFRFWSDGTTAGWEEVSPRVNLQSVPDA